LKPISNYKAIQKEFHTLSILLFESLVSIRAFGLRWLLFFGPEGIKSSFKRIKLMAK